MKEITFLQAINEAVDEEMKRDSSVIILGCDVRVWGAPRGEFKGLVEKYGPDRVLDTPISETAILGGAIGAAVTGMRPIANIMYANFLGVCGDELINQLTPMRYMFGSKIKVPVTIMSYVGAGFYSGAQHSRTLYGWLMSVTGLKIVIPTTPYDAKGLLKTSLREDNPTIFLSHRWFLGKGMKGEEGISIEVIDPRTLVPLDKQTIIDSVKKTSRLVIMDEDPKTGNAAAEISAIIADEAFDHLDAPIKRVCAPDTPVPYSPPMEDFWVPDEDNLIKAVNEIV